MRSGLISIGLVDQFGEDVDGREMTFDDQAVDAMLWMMEHDRHFFVQEFCGFASKVYCEYYDRTRSEPARTIRPGPRLSLVGH